VVLCVCVCCGRDWWCLSREVEICTTSTQRTAERRAHPMKALVVDAANIICACMSVVARSQSHLSSCVGVRRARHVGVAL
jgi:hypothetical protein